MANSSGSLADYAAIFTDPRETIRRIVDTTPRRNVIALAAIAGGLAQLASSWLTALSRPTAISEAWPILVAFEVAFAAVWGIVALYGAAWAIGLASRALGGVASNIEVRAAIAWASIPGIVATALSIVGVLSGVIMPPAMSPHSYMPKFTGSMVQLTLLNSILGIWGFVVELKCIGEVNRFSAWRALGALLLIGVVTLVLILIVVFIAADIGYRITGA